MRCLNFQREGVGLRRSRVSVTKSEGDYPSITRLQARKGRQQFLDGLMDGQNLRR